MTPFALDHPAVSAYLQRLDAATAHLPEDERIEIQEGIRSHLIAALAEAHTDADMHQALDALGAPEEIVGAPAPAAAPTPSQPMVPTGRTSARGPLEIIAVILLLVGAFIPPVIGWFVGVVLLWVSKTWTTGEKLLGTFVAPGGLAGAAVLTFVAPFMAMETCTSSGGAVTREGTVETFEVCSGGMPPALLALLVVFFVIGPVVSAVYLLRVAGKRPAPDAMAR